MNLLIRLARWVRHPPSPRLARVVLGVVAVCLVLVAVEQFWGWPDWLTVARGGGMRGVQP